MKTRQTKEGWWIIDGDSHVGKWVEESGDLAHDKFLIPIIEDILKPGMIAIDCGALYGDHAIAYARAVSTSGTVICMEANPLAYECLTKNAEKFQSNVICMNVVVGEQHGTKAIHVMQEGTEVNVGASRVTTFSDDSNKAIEKEIPCVSIDGLVMDANITQGINFIKLDIEGYEFSALKGAKGTLTHPKNKPILVIEINKSALEAQGAKDTDIYDLLLEVNYAWRIIQPDCHGNSLQFDILAWPNPIERLKVVPG